MYRNLWLMVKQQKYDFYNIINKYKYDNILLSLTVGTICHE